MHQMPPLVHDLTAIENLSYQQYHTRSHVDPSPNLTPTSRVNACCFLVSEPASQQRKGVWTQNPILKATLVHGVRSWCSCHHRSAITLNASAKDCEDLSHSFYPSTTSAADNAEAYGRRKGNGLATSSGFSHRLRVKSSPKRSLRKVPATVDCLGIEANGFQPLTLFSLLALSIPWLPLGRDGSDFFVSRSHLVRHRHIYSCSSGRLESRRMQHEVRPLGCSLTRPGVPTHAPNTAILEHISTDML